MEIELHLYASLKRDLPLKIEVAAGTTIEALFDRVCVPAEAAKIILLNGVHAGVGEVLKDADRLAAFPPLAGG